MIHVDRGCTCAVDGDLLHDFFSQTSYFGINDSISSDKSESTAALLKSDDRHRIFRRFVFRIVWVFRSMEKYRSFFSSVGN